MKNNAQLAGRIIAPGTLGTATTTYIYRNGEAEPQESNLISESLLNVFIDGVLSLRLVCSPLLLEELVTGYLFSEGIINGPQQLRKIELDQAGMQAYVSLKQVGSGLRRQRAPLRILSSNSTSTMISAAERGMRTLPPHIWQQEWVFALADAFDAKAPIYQATNGAHSCLLMAEGQIFCFCEDIARHNALDKAIGYGLMQGVNFSQAILYTSGRVPLDMVNKVIRSGIPVLASHSVATVQAVAAARRYGLTLICKATPRGMLISHDAACSNTHYAAEALRQVRDVDL